MWDITYYKKLFVVCLMLTFNRAAYNCLVTLLWSFA